MRGIVSVFATLAFMAFAQDAGQGIQLYQSGDYEQAEKVLAATATQDPNNGQAELYYGMTLTGKKSRDAEQAFRKADSLTPNNAKVKAGGRPWSASTDHTCFSDWTMG